MSIDENKDVVRRFLAKFGNGDADGLIDSLTDDAIWWIGGKPADRSRATASEVLGATVLNSSLTGYNLEKAGMASWANLGDTEILWTGAAGGNVEWEAWVQRRCPVRSVVGEVVRHVAHAPYAASICAAVAGKSRYPSRRSAPARCAPMALP